MLYMFKNNCKTIVISSSYLVCFLLIIYVFFKFLYVLIQSLFVPVFKQEKNSAFSFTTSTLSIRIFFTACLYFAYHHTIFIYFTFLHSF